MPNVWMHEPSGKFYVVSDVGLTAIGPFAESEILRHWRVANAPSEQVLAIPNYSEHYRPVPLPYHASEWSEWDPAWLPPSVTFHEVPKSGLILEWFTPPEKLRRTLVELVNTQEPWITSEEASFARFPSKSLYWGHPKNSVVLGRKGTPGERLAVVEWAI
jgi:hypothetical protein